MSLDDLDKFSDLDRDTIERVLAGPQHESLTEAMAADVVDFTPLIGDIMAVKRHRRAEEQGIDIPDKPALIENAAADLPPPLDTAVDVAVSQNTVRYVNENSKASPFINLDAKSGQLIAKLPPKPFDN